MTQDFELNWIIMQIFNLRYELRTFSRSLNKKLMQSLDTHFRFRICMKAEKVYKGSQPFRIYSFWSSAYGAAGSSTTLIVPLPVSFRVAWEVGLSTAAEITVISDIGLQFSGKSPRNGSVAQGQTWPRRKFCCLHRSGHRKESESGSEEPFSNSQKKELGVVQCSLRFHVHPGTCFFLRIHFSERKCEDEGESLLLHFLRRGRFVVLSLLMPQAADCVYNFFKLF